MVAETVGVAGRDSRAQRYDRAIAALKDARKKAGITQAELGERLGTRQQFVSKYECGERRLDVIEFLDVASALGVDARLILDI
ncbi:MAG: helix-turn-helix domain-containing protein [Parvibaculaceae bacterium]